MANLLGLIRFRLRTFGLAVQDFLNALSCKDVMVTPNPFLQSQFAQRLTHPRKGNIRIGCAAQDSL
jgi:hypothetical protein